MKQIIIYTSPFCHSCDQLESFLNEKGIPFFEVDVLNNKEAAIDLLKKSGQLSLPQMEINDKIIVGFNKKEIEKEIIIYKEQNSSKSVPK